MAPSRAAVFAALASLIPVGYAQYSGWDPGQVNATMCAWSQARAAVIRDTVYVDGGQLYWSRGMNDGTYASPDADGNTLGLVYSLNFSLPFNLTQNLTSLFQVTSKAAGGSGSANNVAPNYIDGGMLANDNEYFLYGGLLRKTAAFSEPYPDDVLGYQRYQYGPEKGSWRPGFVGDRLPSGMTRYLAYGGAANAPSEQKAWYFSGLKSPTAGPVYQVTTNESVNAVNASSTLITLDMTTQQQEVWSNATLPDFIKGRANPDVVWVPIGSQGILVVIGGVTYPQWAYATAKSPNEVQSQQQSDTFMSTIDIYDVAGGTWYQQPTESGGPTALARGCAVLATAKDYSSFNIYYYGGFNGRDAKSNFNDDVWVLSLPSFTWTKVKAGTGLHSRAGHKCVAPYPDQMMVIGGYTPLAGSSISCLSGGIIQMFNLTSGEWMEGYDPSKHGEYGVPAAVQQKIGGSAAGGATAKTPVASGGWAAPALASVFATPYPTTKLTSWYPYTSTTPTNRPDINPAGSGGGLPSWVAPTLGVILGLVFVSSLLVAWFLWRRRRVLRNRTESEPGTEENGMRILSWIRGQQSDTKALTVTTDESPVSPSGEMTEVNSPVVPPVPAVVRHEVADTQIAELMDTSPRAELQDTGLTPIEIINKHSRFAPTSSKSASDPSYDPSSHYSDHTSMVSRSSGALGNTARAESPAVAGSSPSSPVMTRGHMVSGISGISERDAGHLRHLSEGTISSQGSGAPVQSPVNPEDVISPPTADERFGGDYVAARSSAAPGSPGSPLRKSVFYENPDDLTGRK